MKLKKTAMLIIATVLTLCFVACDSSSGFSGGYNDDYSTPDYDFSIGDVSINYGDDSDYSYDYSDYVSDYVSDTSSETSYPTGSADVTRTIMIYIVGSDLESNYGMATVDIQEMMDADTNYTNNNIVIYTGGTNLWQNDVVSAQENAIYELGERGIMKVAENPSKSMGMSSTLADFLEYGKENYPADRYSLILWNHGGGPMLGYGIDEKHNNDMLDLGELASALKASPFGKSNKLEVLGFDACLMGSVETAWVFKDYAEYFVASQETEPGQGWNYEFLGDLDRCANGADMGKAIIDKYFEYYRDLYNQYPTYESEITLSCLDLSEIEDVEEEVNNLFDSVDSDILKGSISNASRCRYKAKAFGKFSSSSEYDLIDLWDMAKLLSEEYSEKAGELEEALEDFVVYSRSNVRNANGVSIYHPYSNLYYATYWVDTFKNIGFADEYAEYINHFASELSESASSSDSYRYFSKTAGVAVANGQASDLSIKLTEEQMKTFSGAQYYIFRRLSPDETFSKEVEYLHIYSGQDATLAPDGTLNATYQGKAVFGKDHSSGVYSEFPLAMYQIYDGTGEEKFYFPCMFWDYGEDILDMNLKPVNWLMKVKNNVPTLLGAYSMDAEKTDLFPDKYLINSEDYDLYTFANNAYTTTVNQDGNVEFVFTGSSYGFEYTRENGFSLELLPIKDEDKDEYFAVFIIEDIYGNSYTSDFFSLAN